MTHITVAFDVPREVAVYRLQQMGFTVVDIPTHTPFSAPARATRKAKVTSERVFQAPLIVRKPDGSEREIDGVTVEKEMAKVLRACCANLSASRAGADRKYPDARANVTGSKLITTSQYIESFDQANNLVPCTYQPLVSFDDGLILGDDTE